MWVLFNNLFISAGYNKGTNRREGECTMQMFHLAGFPPYYTNSFLLITEAGNAVIIDPSCEPVEYNRILGEHGCLSEAAYMVATPEELMTGYSEYRYRQQKADAVTLETVEYVKTQPLIRAIFCGHLHDVVCETKLTDRITQYVSNFDNFRLVEVE